MSFVHLQIEGKKFLTIVVSPSRLCNTNLACAIPILPMLYQSRLCYTNLACAIPISPVLYQSCLFYTNFACALPISPVLYQFRLCSTNLACAIPILPVLYQSRLCYISFSLFQNDGLHQSGASLLPPGACLLHAGGSQFPASSSPLRLPPSAARATVPLPPDAYASFPDSGG